jgi:hypothetical protein
MKYLCYLFFVFFACFAFRLTAQTFPLSTTTSSTALVVSENDFVGVHTAAKNLQEDIERVSGRRPRILASTPSEKNIVLIGTLGKNTLIDNLIENNKLNVSEIKGKWEAYLIQVVEKPFPDVDRALVIVGSDKRGTIFGIYEVSKKIGVSPWHWWADVPVRKQTELYFPVKREVSQPKIKYRGIFINDEEPALGRWAVENYGGFNHEFYEKVFTLILRLKGNYLWPAMWWASFNSDDPLNPKLADDYGVVIGTTHHEPMNRAHAEWKAFKGSAGAWNYETNAPKLQEFWTEGIKRMDDRETIVSLAMRGDGDMAMDSKTNISLLEKIVNDQRQIIRDVTKKPITETPQLWALYKEVQDYYDQGMRVPDDVTLLLCDDNWGNIRKLPELTDSLRSGGHGIYYHFDYVGGPRNYKWVNTTHIARIREQMNLAFQYKADRIWIVNVGDIKPMEFPISFFLDYAWNPSRWKSNDLGEYTRNWTTEQFGEKYSKEIAEIISRYSFYNSRRKPELLSAETYSLINYREAELVVQDYAKLAEETERIGQLLPKEYFDSYFQLVLHPVKASANLNELWVTVAKNRLYAKQGRASANMFADQAQHLFEKDAARSYQYNKSIASGKWNHMMDQTHISYTYWQQPEKDVLPEVKKISVPDQAEMGISVEQDSSVWPGELRTAALPVFDNRSKQTFYVDIFNRGGQPFDFTITTKAEWIKLNIKKGTLTSDQRVFISIDWQKFPGEKRQSTVAISQKNGKTVSVSINALAFPRDVSAKEFVETNGYVSINAEHFNSKSESHDINWNILSDIGKLGSGVTSSPVTAQGQLPDATSPYLEYSFYSQSDGPAKLHAYFSPTLNFNGSDGLRYAVSIDNEKPQVINLHEDKSNRVWENWVANNIIEKISTHTLKAGHHTLRFWRVDPGVIVQKFVINMGGLKASYLGPPETK